MADHYTTPYTNDEINAIIRAYDKDDTNYVVFSNKDYVTPKNRNTLNTDAFWRQLCLCNRQLFTFILLRCCDKNNIFKWNTILNLYYTTVNQNVLDDEMYPLKIRNFSSSDTYNGQIETALIHPVKRSIGYARELFVDVHEAFNGPSDSGYNYIYFLNKNGTFTWSKRSPAQGYNYDTIYETLIHFLFGKESDLTFVSTDNVYYDLLFTYSSIYKIDPGTITRMSSFITKYTNNCGIKAPSYTEGYVFGLKVKIEEMYRSFSVTFLDLTKQDYSLDWESSILVVTYIADSTVFTIAYDLEFASANGGSITKMTALQYNGTDLYTVFTVDMASAFSVTYINGLAETSPGVHVTKSKITLDVSITYDMDASPMYSLAYRNMWYNDVKTPGNPSILCIGLVH